MSDGSPPEHTPVQPPPPTPPPKGMSRLGFLQRGLSILGAARVLQTVAPNLQNVPSAIEYLKQPSEGIQVVLGNHLLGPDQGGTADSSVLLPYIGGDLHPSIWPGAPTQIINHGGLEAAKRAGAPRAILSVDGQPAFDP